MCFLFALYQYNNVLGGCKKYSNMKINEMIQSDYIFDEVMDKTMELIKY
jgi:hypothetical protein